MRNISLTRPMFPSLTSKKSIVYMKQRLKAIDIRKTELPTYLALVPLVPFVGITATDPITTLRILYGSYESVDPTAEALASAGRQQCYWNKDI
jgi:hypothetical protein